MTDRITYLIFHDNRDGTMRLLRRIKWDRGMNAFAHLMVAVKRTNPYAVPMTPRVANSHMPNAGWDGTITIKSWGWWMEEKP